MKQITAIIIDVKNKTVTETKIDSGLTAMQKVVGGYIERVNFWNNPHGDDLFVDEEGSFKDSNLTGTVFSIEGAEGIFYGNGLIVGHDNNGKTVSCKSSRDEIAMGILFFDAKNI